VLSQLQEAPRLLLFWPVDGSNRTVTQAELLGKTMVVTLHQPLEDQTNAKGLTFLMDFPKKNAYCLGW